MKYTFYLNNWNFFPQHPIFWCNVKRNFLRNRISRVDCYFLSISPFFSVKDRWNEVFREELLLLLFFFPFSDLHGIQYFFPIGGILDHLFIIRLSQRQIKMTFKFHSIMAMTLLYIPSCIHRRPLLYRSFIMNIYEYSCLCNLFTVVNL